MKSLDCYKCEKPMHLIKTKYKDFPCEAWRCTACKETMYTDEEVGKIARHFDQECLKNDYSKTAMKIGSSYGITFPKAVVDVFRLSDKRTKMKIIPEVEKNKIIIEVTNSENL
jgi:hypothetical protein